MKSDARSAARGAFEDRSVDWPQTRMTGGQSPSRSNAIRVPSLEVTVSIELSFSRPGWVGSCSPGSFHLDSTHTPLPANHECSPHVGEGLFSEDEMRRPTPLRSTLLGSATVRRALKSGAHYVLGPFGSDSDLRRHGEKIASRGGKNSKKRAVVAVARKLSVLLHSLWISGEVYDPLRNAHRRERREEAS